MAWSLIAAAGLFLLLAWVFNQAATTPLSYWGQHIGSWARMSRTTTNDDGSKGVCSYGSDVAGIACVVAFIAFAYGVRMLFKLPLKIDTETSD